MTSYVPEAYNSLPSLREAAHLFNEKQAMTHLLGDIRQLFLDSGAYARYGVSLLHKHFPLENDQRLVDYRNVSSPWTVNSSSDFVVPKYEGYISPRTFRFFDKAVMPFEFEFCPSSPPHEQTDNAFLEKVSVLFHEKGLENVLGVRALDTYDPEVSVEITEGKANIMIPEGSIKESDLIAAVWIFGLDEDQKCHCREYCFKSSEGNHLADHGCS